MTLELAQAAQWIREADGLIITAGAGMEADSGLPDLRSTAGLWQVFPALQAPGYEFSDIANNKRFRDRPRLAWGFYGQRLNLYRETRPHAGFTLLLQWLKQKGKGFVFTSNVGGQFKKAGFDPRRVIECHGSIHFLQCTGSCKSIWPADYFMPQIRESQLQNTLPCCPECGQLARPNILMFDDLHWNNQRTRQQISAIPGWRDEMQKPLVIEIGAGHTIPSVQFYSEQMNCPVIRINPKVETGIQGHTLNLAGGALETLQAIAKESGF